MDILVSGINLFIHSTNFTINVLIIALRLLIMCWNICVPFIPWAITLYALQKLCEYRERKNREADDALNDALNLVFRMNVAASINTPPAAAAA